MHHGVKGMKWGEINWLDKIKASPQLRAFANAWSNAYKNYQSVQAAKVSGNAKKEDVEVAKEKAKTAARNYKGALAELIGKYKSENADKFNKQQTEEEIAAKEQADAERAEKKAKKKEEKEQRRAEELAKQEEAAKAAADKAAEKEAKKKAAEEKKKAAEEKKAQKEQKQSSSSSSGSSNGSSGASSSRSSSSKSSGTSKNNKPSNGEMTVSSNQPTSPSKSSSSPKVSSRSGSSGSNGDSELKSTLESGSIKDAIEKRRGLKRAAETKDAEGWDSIRYGSIGSTKVSKSIKNAIRSSTDSSSVIDTITVAARRARSERESSTRSRISSSIVNPKTKKLMTRTVSRGTVRAKAKSYNSYMDALKH